MSRPHLFISYVRDNSATIDRLARDLRKCGAVVWLDRDDIKPGQRWKPAIEEAISAGAYFVACYSKEMSTRSETYMFSELRLAIDRLRRMPTDRIWFIPVSLDGTLHPKMAISDYESLDSLQVVSLHEGWEAGLCRILDVIGVSDPVQRRATHLLQLIQDDPRDRKHALEQLTDFDEVPSRAVKVLVEVLSNPDPELRILSVRALARVRSAADEVVDPLVGLLGDPSPQVCQQASAAIASVGRYSPATVPALLRALRASSPKVRTNAASTLGYMGPQGLPALDILSNILRKEDGSLRRHAAFALSRMGAEAATVLVEALGDCNAEVRWAAAQALWDMGPIPADLVPPLESSLGGSDNRIICILKAILQEGESLEAEYRREDSNAEISYAIGTDEFGSWRNFTLWSPYHPPVTQCSRLIPSGRYLMGSAPADAVRSNEMPQSDIAIPRAFWMFSTACSRGLWQAVMDHLPVEPNGRDMPITSVSWNDAHLFMSKLNSRLRRSHRLVLPSEAQWEYACRAGTKGAYSFGDEITRGLAHYADVGPVAVASLPPNVWGLHEMHGNVLEWCADTWHENHEGAHFEGQARRSNALERVVRGGSWDMSAPYLRSACRFYLDPSTRRADPGVSVLFKLIVKGSDSSGPRQNATSQRRHFN